MAAGRSRGGTDRVLSKLKVSPSKCRAAIEVGIPTIGRYTDHFQLVGIFKMWVKNSQKWGTNGKFCTKLRKIGHFCSKGGKSKISGGSPEDVTLKTFI